jgi:hypothetical protein
LEIVEKSKSQRSRWRRSQVLRAEFLEWTIEGVGEERRGSSMKRAGTLREVRRSCELERTAMFSMKVFSGMV